MASHSGSMTGSTSVIRRRQRIESSRHSWGLVEGVAALFVVLLLAGGGAVAMKELSPHTAVTQVADAGR